MQRGSDEKIRTDRDEKYREEASSAMCGQCRSGVFVANFYAFD